MSLEAKHVQYGEESGYFAHPARAKTPLPALLILQEAWGLNAHIEDVARRFANAGYAALAPDLFSRAGERPAELTVERLDELQGFLNLSPSYFADANARSAALAARPEAERARIEGTLAVIQAQLANRAAFLPRLARATSWLRDECEITRGAKVGALGFCLGGGLAALLACHDSALAAAVVFYGNAPPAELMSQITCPVLAFTGSLDPRLITQLPAFEQAMRAAGTRFESIVYEGAHHAFFNDTRPSYDARASRDAFARTLELLRTVMV